MTDGVKNIFNDIAADPALSEDERVSRMATAIDGLLAGLVLGALGVEELEPYYQFKRPVMALHKTAKDAYQSLFNSSLVVHVGQLAQETAAGDLTTDVSPSSKLRKKAAMVREMLATERQWLATMNAPHAQLVAAYKTIVKAEEKSSRLPSGILEESRMAQRLLDNMEDKGFRTSIHRDVETILRNAEFTLDAYESYQQSEQEKKLLRGHLAAGLTTGGKTLPAPAVARFRKQKVSP